jgi:trimethylamine--corrinoid protein Co-methyltransferase
MTTNSVSIPSLSLLSIEQIEIVHSHSLNILKNSGLKVDSKRAIEIFGKSAGIKVLDDKVFFSEEIVNRAISTCTKSVTIFDRNGIEKFTLSGYGNQAVFGIGVTNLYFQNPMDDSVVPFLRKHMETGTRLGNALESFDVISTLGSPHDVDTTLSDLYATLDIYANTVKPVILLISNEKLFEPAIDLLEHLHGDLSRNPFVIPYFNPVTPLILNNGTVDKMIVSIERNLPVIYSNYAMYGATSPISAAGSLALLNAELLAGLVFSQLIKEGSSVILGSLPASFDMNAMGSVYTTKSFLLNLACAEMMDYYKIPHCGTSGSGVGWNADLLAAGHLWINHLTSCIGKAGLVPFVGGNFDSMAFSPNLIVYSDYVIQKSREFAKGFSMNEKDFNIEEIEQVGSGGDYLTSENTLNSFSDELNLKEIWKNLSIEKWMEENQPDAMQKLRKHTADIIQNLQKPYKHDEFIKTGEEFIRKFRFG